MKLPSNPFRNAAVRRCSRREDGAVVHRTRPISDGDGRHIGHRCQCRQVITTERTRQSVPVRNIHVGSTVVVGRKTKAHKRRVAAA